MATQVRPQPLLTRDTYFSAGKDLFRVVDRADETVLVENCKTLDLQWFNTDDLDRVTYHIVVPTTVGKLKKGGRAV